MFRRIFGVGLLILLLMGIFGGFGSRTRSAYYEGYADGVSAQTSAAAEDGGTAVPVYPPQYDGFGHGRFLGWGALGILGIFAFFFKIAFFFLLAMIVFEKFGQHQPLNRQAERYAREGVELVLGEHQAVGAQGVAPRHEVGRHAVGQRAVAIEDQGARGHGQGHRHPRYGSKRKASPTSDTGPHTLSVALA